MAVTITQPFQIKGLNEDLHKKDLESIFNLYSKLPDDSEQPPVNETHIKNLARLFTTYGAHEALGIHLVHGHFESPAGTIMLGKNLLNPYARWTKMTKVDDVDVKNIHGHIFVLTSPDTFTAYEYQEGSAPNLASVDSQFFRELTDYLVKEKLTTIFGLQVLDKCAPANMAELILEDGTIMLDPAKTRGCHTTRQTGWSFELVDGEPRVCKANETHAGMTTGNHKVFNAGKPLPQLDTEEQLWLALKEAKVL